MSALLPRSTVVDPTIQSRARAVRLLGHLDAADRHRLCGRRAESRAELLAAVGFAELLRESVQAALAAVGPDDDPDDEPELVQRAMDGDR